MFIQEPARIIILRPCHSCCYGSSICEVSKGTGEPLDKSGELNFLVEDIQGNRLINHFDSIIKKAIFSAEPWFLSLKAMYRWQFKDQEPVLYHLWEFLG